MRGTFRKISLPRRLIIDLMHASMQVPFVSLRRSLTIRPLAEARLAAAERPGWAAIFAKAFSLVAREEPVLRTLFVVVSVAAAIALSGSWFVDQVDRLRT